MRHPRLIGACGLALIAFGVAMPRAWYDTLPILRSGLPDPPIRGVTLLQLSLVVEGLVLLVIAWRRPSFVPIAGNALLPDREAECGPLGDLSTRAARWWLLGITLLALSLRVFRLDTGLWLDEIAPLFDYSGMRADQVAASYFSSNNHLLNTLLVKAFTGLLGQRDWVVRLPAVLFGVATVPSLYWVSRLALTRRASLGAALLLAVSYHHIFFSQNARGYSGYLLFSLLATGYLVRALSRDRFRDWALFVAASVANFAALLTSAFVFASHALVGLLALAVIRKRGGSPLALCRRLLAVFSIASFLGFQLYATALPRILIVMRTTYAQDESSGYRPLSLEFVRELIGGIAAGFGPGLLVAAIPFLAAALAGLVLVVRLRWTVAAGLGLPGIVAATFLLVRGYTFSPRFFLIGLPLAAMCAVAAVTLASDFTARRLRARAPLGAARLGARIATVTLAALAGLSLVSLPSYYALPKQAYAEAIRFVEQSRAPGGAVIVIYVAEWGFRYYGGSVAERAGSYQYVRTLEDFDKRVAALGATNTMVVVTLPRVLRLAIPDLAARIEREWTEVRRFPGSIRDGDITILRVRSSLPEAPDRRPFPARAVKS